MTQLSAKIAEAKANPQNIWATTLDSTSLVTAGPLEVPGIERVDYSKKYGKRKFMYVQFHAATTRGQVTTFLDPVAVTATATGTVSSIVTTGLTANLYNGCFARCLDDAGAAGAAPEGEVALITSNTATLITLDTNEGSFSAATALNDTFNIIVPYGVQVGATGDVAVNVAGVAMATQAQYSWGWVQFEGLNTYTLFVAAGTTVTKKKSLIVTTGGLLTNGSTSAAELRVAFAPVQVTTDTVARYAPVVLACNKAFALGASA